MKAVEVKKDIYWVGAKDWNLRNFHGYETSRGSTYNAYLIKDEKNVLVDAVKAPFTKELLLRLSSVIDLKDIDIVVCNHVEMDHSGAIPEIMKLCPKAKIVTNASGKKGLLEHYDGENWDFEVIRTGDEMSIGKRTLKFVCTPMLHWPDSMMTYIKEDKLLMPNDAFGQHYTTGDIFAKNNPMDIVIDEAKKYFANILYPYCRQAEKALAGIDDLEIEMIAPSHGCIWQGEEVKKIMELYEKWASNVGENKAVVVYDTMWESTEILAQAVRSEFENQGIEVTYRNLQTSHYSDVIVDFLDAKYVAIGSPTLNSNVLPTVASFITYMRGLAPQNKKAFCFGSYGWKPGAINDIQKIFEELKWETPVAPFGVKYIPNANIEEEIRNKIKELIA